jgi:hypothetical protein
VTYGSFVVDIKNHKEEKERTRLTVGGNQIEYSIVSFPPWVPHSLSLGDSNTW